MPLFRRSLFREKVVGFLSRKSVAGFAIELVDRGDVAAAAFDSENFDALDAEVLQHVLGSVLGLQFLEKRVDLFNELTTTVLLPMRASGSPAYDADGKLLAHLAWYPRLVREIEWANHNAAKGVAEQAIPDLEEARDELLARRFHWPFPS